MALHTLSPDVWTQLAAPMSNSDMQVVMRLGRAKLAWSAEPDAFSWEIGLPNDHDYGISHVHPAGASVGLFARAIGTKAVLATGDW